MQLRLLAGLIAFQHFLDQINTPARAIQFVAEQLIGGASGVAKSAVHAGSQDRIGFGDIGINKKFRRNGSLHNAYKLA